MKHILCIDIGGTRIKSAVLPERPSLEDVRTAPSTVIRTLGWLNHSLPKLIDPDHWPSLAAYYRQQNIFYDAVALSVPGVIDGEGRFKRDDLVNGPAKVPEKLVEAFQRAAGCPVTAIKDADTWMYGFQEYATLNKLNPEYPAVLMAFGTGFGISAAVSPGSVASIEAAARPAPSWRKLAQVSGFPITEGWQVHHVIGRQFFAYVESDHPEWDHLTIRNEYTKRVRAALDDILPWIEGALGATVRTIALAGGNAEYVSVRGLSDEDRTVIPLTDLKTTLSPDLITVLGVEASTRRPRPLALQ